MILAEWSCFYKILTSLQSNSSLSQLLPSLYLHNLKVLTYISNRFPTRAICQSRTLPSSWYAASRCCEIVECGCSMWRSSANPLVLHFGHMVDLSAGPRPCSRALAYTSNFVFLGTFHNRAAKLAVSQLDSSHENNLPEKETVGERWLGGKKQRRGADQERKEHPDAWCCFYDFLSSVAYSWTFFYFLRVI